MFSAEATKGVSQSGKEFPLTDPYASHEISLEEQAESNYSDLDVDAIALYGTKKSVNAITGSLPMLR